MGGQRKDRPLFILLLKTVFKAYTAVEYEVFGWAVLVVNAEIAVAHKLIAFRSRCACNILFSLTACENFKWIFVKIIEEVSVACIGIRNRKEVIVKSYFRIKTVVSVNPMDCASYLSAVGSISALCFGIILCINLNNIAVFILFAACAFYDVCRLDSCLLYTSDAADD